GGSLYRIGGLDTTANAPVTTVEKKDALNNWSFVSPMPEAKYFAQVAVIGTDIYVMGGLTTGSVASLKTYVYHTTTDTWDDGAMADLPESRWAGVSGVLNGQVIVAGGVVNGFISNDTKAWDASTNTWIQKDAMVQPRYRGAGEVASNGLYEVGGVAIGDPS